MSATPIAFDLDGTLIDSAPDIQAACNAMLAAFDAPPIDRAQTIACIGRGAGEFVRRILAAAAPQLDENAAQAVFRARYAEQGATLSRPFPGAVEALLRLRAAGRPLGLVTNKPHDVAEAVLRDLALDHLFDVVLGQSAARPAKPDPAGLTACFAALGGSGLYVGDSETDAATAAAAHAPFALYRHGYRHGPAEAMGAALIFEDFATLAEYALTL